MTDSALYTTAATAWGGRAGRVASTDGQLDLTLSTPTELGGAGGATNPEQMFAAGYAACFHSALQNVARAEGVDVSESAVSVTISLVGSVKDREIGLAARIEAQLPGIERGTADHVLDLAHRFCPYSRAVAGNIPVELTVVEDD